MIREEILAGVPDRYLTIIEYNKHVEWEEEGKEFSVDGKFYDIVKTRNIKGKIFFYCIDDENEEQLIKKFASAVKTTADSDTGKNNKHSFKSQLVDQLVPVIISSLSCNNLLRQKYPHYYNAELVSHSREIIIPPPWNNRS